MPKPETLERFIARVESNAHVEAIEEFYTEGASMQENLEPPRVGRDTLVAHERRAGGEWLPVPLVPQPDGTWAGSFPPTYGAHVDLEYWLEARDTAGNSGRLPATPGAVFAVSLGRWAEPKEIAPVFVFFASDGASYVTGQIVAADGGMTIR